MSIGFRIWVIVAASAAVMNVAAPVSGQGGQPERRAHEQVRRPTGPELKVGQLAPTFTLSASKGEEVFTLKEFRGKRPVIIFFGSYS